DLLEPLWLDRCNRPREKTRRFDKFCRHDPASCFFYQRRSGPHVKLDATRAKIRRFPIVGVESLETDVSEQAGEQRKMNLLEGCRGFVCSPSEFADDSRELRVHFLPFPDPPRRKKASLQIARELAVRLLV